MLHEGEGEVVVVGEGRMWWGVQGWLVFIPVGVVLVVFVVVSVIGYDLDRRDCHRASSNVSPEFTSAVRGDGNGNKEEIIDIYVLFQEILSPYFRLSDSWRSRCWGEMKMFHPYLNIFSRYIRGYSRPHRALSLLMNILIVFCIQAVIFSNNSLCDNSSTQVECNSLKLVPWFETSAVCFWEEDIPGGHDHCSSYQIGGRFQLLLKIVLLSALLSIPLTVISDCLILYVLNANTKMVETKVSATEEGPPDEVASKSSRRFFDRLYRREDREVTQCQKLLGTTLDYEVAKCQEALKAYLESVRYKRSRLLRGNSTVLFLQL